MLTECCSQEKAYMTYYGNIAQRFCMIHRRWQDAFEGKISQEIQLYCMHLGAFQYPLHHLMRAGIDVAAVCYVACSYSIAAAVVTLV
jgi:hypothetical protein